MEKPRVNDAAVWVMLISSDTGPSLYEGFIESNTGLGVPQMSVELNELLHVYTFWVMPSTVTNKL